MAGGRQKMFPGAPDRCSCFHIDASHINGSGRCREDDSYGLPCACPSFDYDANQDEKIPGEDDDWDASNPDGDPQPPIWPSGRTEEC